MSMMEMEAKLVHLQCCILYHSDIPLVFGRKRVGRVSDCFQELGTFLVKAGRRWKVGEKYIGMARFHDVSEDKEF